MSRYSTSISPFLAHQICPDFLSKVHFIPLYLPALSIRGKRRRLFGVGVGGGERKKNTVTHFCDTLKCLAFNSIFLSVRQNFSGMGGRRISHILSLLGFTFKLFGLDAFVFERVSNFR